MMRCDHTDDHRWVQLSSCHSLVMTIIPQYNVCVMLKVGTQINVEGHGLCEVQKIVGANKYVVVDSKGQRFVHSVERVTPSQTRRVEK